jgi:HEAT repeat protein
LKALEALGKTGGPDIVKLLAPYLESETWEEKLTAARALATSGVQGLKVLQDFEKNHEDETSDLIRQVLEEFGMEPSHG